MNNFTPEDMIRFLYNEMNAEETAAIQLALESDWTLREKFNILKAAKEGLSKIQFSPRPDAIHAIMMHADEVTKAVAHE